jgi:carboxypeptidase Q
LKRTAFLVATISACLSAAKGQVLSPEVRKVAADLREKALAGSRAVEWVRQLTDEVGPRLSGSPGDVASVSWALTTLKEQGFDNVHGEKVMVRAWRRGVETGEVISPVKQALVLTALGGSVATPAGGLEAEIVEEPSIEAMQEKGASAVKGKIVFFNKKLERGSGMTGYGKTVDVRTKGASAAAKLGAAGVLIRSIGTHRNRIPHTGAVDYTAEVPKIPAAALAFPDAELLERLVRQGKPVRVRFTLTCSEGPEAESANVVGEIRGSSKPEEIVLLGAHRDSWDLGTGAIDDAAGCGIVTEAARLIGALPKHPPRTIRVCLYASEENGIAGGKAYFRAHEAELPKFTAALESDSGTDRPVALDWTAGASAEPFVREVAALVRPIGVELGVAGGGGADVGTLKVAGVPMFGFRQDVTRYFDYHHSANDTFDKIDPNGLDKNVAAVAVFAYCAASMPQLLERIPPEKRGTATPVPAKRER